MHVPLAREQHELLLCESRIDEGERDDVECEIPGGKPGILPFIRHGDDVAGVDVRPLVVAAFEPFARRRRRKRIAVEPVADDERIVLFTPQHAGKCLALNRAEFVGELMRIDFAVKGIGFGLAEIEECVEVFSERPVYRIAAQANPDDARFLRRKRERVM